MELYRDRSGTAEARQVLELARGRGVGLAIGPEEDWLSEVQRERVIEEYLEHGLKHLETGLELATVDGKKGRQFSTRAGPVDLLALDRNRRYVVIELKKGRASDKVVGQLLRYIQALTEEYGWRRMRGFVVTEKVDNKLRLSWNGLKSDSPNRKDWKLYRADFKINFSPEA